MSEDGIWVMLLIPCYIEDNGNTYDVFLSFKRGSTGNEHTLGMQLIYIYNLFVTRLK
ncbi:hypothetical protein HanPI659440_Chr05g0188731 [Helianthus annuus]|nr:hypothetical protein HanPI659440_Chr05g0188731 [Helianthus annuus]